MAEQIRSTETRAAPIQPVKATDSTYISAEDYMATYAHDFHEWVNGEVIKMSPVSGKHDVMGRYLEFLLEAYLSLKPIGTIRQAPFVMRIDATNSRREPDLQVILDSNTGDLTDTAMVGPADICIEIVSAESVARDYGEKFEEYEKAAVKEYWIIDPLRSLCRFYRLTGDGIYQDAPLNEDGSYQTPLLPGLIIKVSLLWQEKMPGYFDIGKAVQDMLGQA